MSYIDRLKYSCRPKRNRKSPHNTKMHKIRQYRPLLFLVLVVLFIFACLSEIGLSSVSDELTKEIARNYLSTSINTAVSEALKNEDIETAFVNLTRDEDGQILSVSANSDSLSKLKLEITEKLNKSLNKKANTYIPIGSLSDVALLNGRGFKVPIKMYFEGSADVSFSSEFTSAGINQSCHRITMTVSAVVVSQSKKFSVNEEFETTIVISENIIVGNVPSLITGTIT